MVQFVRAVRRSGIFLIATVLWLHALFFLNIKPEIVDRIVMLTRLAGAEIALFTILLVVSFLAASGFWRLFGSVLYIYFFPFVLTWYLIYFLFLGLRGMHRRFVAQSAPQPSSTLSVAQNAVVTSSVYPAIANGKAPKDKLMNVLSYLTRPFRRFAILWCFLLLVTTHSAVTWLCLIVILVQLARKISLIVELLFFSDPLLRKIGATLPTGLHNAVSAVKNLTNDVAPTSELNQLWEQIKLYRKILGFLTDDYLLSRWAWVIGTALFGSIYLYFALLFSFAYYGIARVNGVPYSWPDSLVASLFIPFFVSELPHLLAARLLGGIHCTLVLTVGIGTVFNYVQRKVETIRTSANDLKERFTEQSFQEKYLILEQKVVVVGAPESEKKTTEP